MASTVTDLLSGISSSVAVKAPCRVATTANITLSGLQTVDGVSLAADDRVLVKDQTSAINNGIYVVNTSAWARAKDFDGKRDVVKGTLVKVNEGTANAGFWFISSSDPITIGTSSISFARSSVSPFIVVSAFAQTLVDDADEATARATLQLGSMSTQSSTAVSVTGGTLSGVGITGGSSINNSPIGTSTPSSAQFTSLKATSLLDLSSTGAGQIKFPITQNPSTDPNTLDHYVEYKSTEWLPVLRFGGLSTGITYAVQVGAATQTGRVIYAPFAIQLSNKSTEAGAASITLPVACAADGISRPDSLYFTNLGTTWTSVVSLVVSGQAVANIHGSKAGSTSMVALIGTDFTTGTLITGNIVYNV